MRSLVIARDPETRGLLERTLRERGHRPAVHEDPDTALEAWERESFPLVVLGAWDGAVEICRRLGEIARRRGAFLLVVAEGPARRLSPWIDAGADDALPLPVDGETLALRVEIAERRARARKARWNAGEGKAVEQRLRLTQFTVDHAADAVFWIGSDARFLYVNHTACESLGYSREELLQKTVHDIDPNFPAETWEETWASLGRGSTFSRESLHRRKDGSHFPVELTANYVRFEDLEAHITVARDISERKQAEEMLRHSAFHDALTGLPNRTLFMDRLQSCLVEARRARRHRFGVLFLDLDRFKVINDSLGHAVGDALLAEIGDRLRGAVRSPDTVARIGGDEFLILLDDLDGAGDAVRVAERIQREVRKVLRIQKHEIFTSASIGIAVGAKRYRRAEEILRDADIAMYRSKAQGGAVCTVFDQEMHLRAVSRLELETDLRRALQKRQFRLHYQPIVTGDGGVRSLEALLRWHHPGRGVIAPGDFISAAEETNLIVPLSWWVFGEVCRQLRWLDEELKEAAGLRLSLNLSSRLLSRPDLVPRLREALELNQVEASRLGIEITESVILDHPESVEGVLGQIDDLGVEVAIDDFGAGYSSLRYLSHLPLRLVKIDRAFIRRIAEERKSLEIVRSVVSLVHKLGMQAVAEGVETTEQRELLRELGCDYLQGYLFGRPLEPGEVGPWLRRQRQGVMQGAGSG